MQNYIRFSVRAKKSHIEGKNVTKTAFFVTKMCYLVTKIGVILFRHTAFVIKDET